MSDEELRAFCLSQAVALIQSIKGDSFGVDRIAPMELAELLFHYVRTGEANDPELLHFG